ncbi:MAG TPA: PIN domain-containing protein [Nitrosopumilaceae archaeon]|nr:PIN domain-containing protein [Nitrosopumilaceae archaeon]
MNKVLVDTSVWIDFLNGRTNKQTTLFKLLIEEDAPVVLCPLIIQEVLQGIKADRDFHQVKDVLSGFEVLKVDPEEGAYGAAALYRSIRKQGITIRKSYDCLITFYCISCNASLLHNDTNFNRIAQYSPLEIYT